MPHRALRQIRQIRWLRLRRVAMVNPRHTARAVRTLSGRNTGYLGVLEYRRTSKHRT